MEEVEKMKKIIKKTIKIFVFISIASLPFITVTQLMGLDTFLDSFENSDHYVCLQNKGFFASKIDKEEYIIIQKSSHPEFKFQDDESIIYWDNDGEILCNKLKRIENVGSLKRYNINDNENEEQIPIYENQIVGKIINTIDNNIWYSISITIWDISVQNLNFNSFITND
jgi:hypothetical protein